MSQPKFTPGPWRVIGNELRHEKGDAYAVIQTSSLAIDIIAPSAMDAEHMSNARLIAAAPALYEALRNILADAETADERRTPADWDFAVCHAVEYARAALALVESEGQ